MSTPKTQRTPTERHTAFINGLLRHGANLSSPDRNTAAQARKVLAQLRRFATTGRYEPAAFEVVFDHEPPPREETVWLTVAGLFALNPHPPETGTARKPLGKALGMLKDTRYSDGAHRRLQQLTAGDIAALPQHLRTTLRLLSSHSIAVDFHTLLADLLTLLGPDSDTTQIKQIQWRWAREFHAHTTTTKPQSTDDATSGDDSP